MKHYILLFCCFLLTTFGCREIEFESEIYIYANDFDSEDYTGINGVYISEFDGDKVMGNFNNSGFTLTLPDLPEHDFIRVTFDLYIHDSWEGNTNNSNSGNADHDAWILEFDPDEKIKPAEKIYFETTFSNGLCIPGWCFTQSYPNEFPFNNRARTEALVRTMEGRCLWKDSPIGTSLYKFDRVFPHNRKSTVIKFFDRLKQTKEFAPVCEESWSLDNLGVSVFTTNL